MRKPINCPWIEKPIDDISDIVDSRFNHNPSLADLVLADRAATREPAAAPSAFDDDASSGFGSWSAASPESFPIISQFGAEFDSDAADLQTAASAAEVKKRLWAEFGHSRYHEISQAGSALAGTDRRGP
jgi:hypothetical protein